MAASFAMRSGGALEPSKRLARGATGEREDISIVPRVCACRALAPVWRDGDGRDGAGGGGRVLAPSALAPNTVVAESGEDRPAMAARARGVETELRGERALREVGGREPRFVYVGIHLGETLALRPHQEPARPVFALESFERCAALGNQVGSVKIAQRGPQNYQFSLA